jgi:type II secretory pathway component PulF
MFAWITTFVMLYIIPQFQQMFEEFGFELPPVTLIFMKMADLFCKFWFVFFGLAIIVGVFYMGRYLKELRRVFSPSRWNQTEHTPQVQTKLNLAWLCDSQIDFDNGLKQLARFAPNKRMTSKIQKAATRTAAGQEPWKALGIAGVLSNAESQSLQTASSLDTQAWLLRRMAFAQSTRLQAWSATRIRLFVSLSNIVLGLFVLLFCLAMFTPLLQIIRGLSG